MAVSETIIHEVYFTRNYDPQGQNDWILIDVIPDERFDLSLSAPVEGDDTSRIAVRTRHVSGNIDAFEIFANNSFRVFVAYELSKIQTLNYPDEKSKFEFTDDLMKAINNTCLVKFSGLTEGKIQLLDAYEISQVTRTIKSIHVRRN